MTRADKPSDDLYRAVIGEPNQEFYLSYFRRADDRGYAPVSWHWPVLFIGLFWLLYRKQYVFALVVFALAIHRRDSLTPYLPRAITRPARQVTAGSPVSH